MIHSSLLADLTEFSRKVGRDPMLVQGAGGNSSVKINDTLLVKPSGLWLSEAQADDYFVPVDLASGKPQDFPLKPSSEYMLHCLMPHKIVMHVHSINTIAHAVRTDGKELITPKLNGLNWAWIDYVRPGEPLADAVKQAMAQKPDVLILANHGLVVAGDSCSETDALLQEVERRLDLPVRAFSPITPPDDIPSGWELPQDARIHDITADAALCKKLSKGPLYPDHVIFLTNKLRIRPGQGVLVAENLTKGGQAMITALYLLAERLDPSASLSYLTDHNIAELLGWDVEKERQKLDKIK